MTLVGDAMTALRNVVLMQERVLVLSGKVDRLADDVKGLNDYVVAIDRRMIRIEAMIEMAGRVSDNPQRIAEGKSE